MESECHKVGMGDEITKSVIGIHGIGNRNERSDRLIDFCYVNNLCITNTRYKQAKYNRSWTWESPDGQTHNQIDYIIVSRKLIASVRNSRAFPSADCGSDHQLVMANIRLKWKTKKTVARIKKIDIQQLKNEDVKRQYHTEVEAKWQKTITEPIISADEEWNKVKSIIQDTSKEVVGYKKEVQGKEWLSNDTIELMAERRKYKSKRSEHPDMAKHHNYLCRQVRKSAKTDKENHIYGICKEVEEAREQNKTRAVYEGIRKITEKHAPRIKSVKNKQGIVLTEPVQVKERWKEYFDQLYNDPNEMNEQYLEDLPEVHNEEDIPNIGIDEVRSVIRRMKTKKAPGIDNITAEEIDAATQDTGLLILHRLCKEIWEQEEMPTEWKRSIIIPIYKKGDRMDCSNYWGISLLSHCSKVFSSILLQRIKKRTEEILSEAQAGFRVGRSTIDQIFTLRQIAEKYEEYGRALYICYVDFRKAFDSVWRKGLWKTMRYYGYPEKILRILENAYKDTFSTVRVDGDITDWFDTIVGVLQGCVLSPLLFNIFLELIIAMALDNTESGAEIGGELLTDLRFADDIAMPSNSVEGLQGAVKRVEEVSKDMGMRINVTKAEVQYLGKGKKECHIQIDGQRLKQTDTFVYLGGTISTTGGAENDVVRRIGLARGIFQRLNKIWTAKEISKATKMKAYEVLVLSVLLYNSETWTLKGH